MKVIETIQSTMNPGVEGPVEILSYLGDNDLEAASALMSAMQLARSDFKWTRTLSIRVEF